MNRQRPFFHAFCTEWFYLFRVRLSSRVVDHSEKTRWRYEVSLWQKVYLMHSNLKEKLKSESSDDDGDDNIKNCL